MGKVSGVMLLFLQLGAQSFSRHKTCHFTVSHSKPFSLIDHLSVHSSVQTLSLHLFAGRPHSSTATYLIMTMLTFHFFLLYRFIDLNISHGVKKGPIFKILFCFRSCICFPSHRITKLKSLFFVDSSLRHWPDVTKLHKINNNNKNIYKYIFAPFSNII